MLRKWLPGPVLCPGVEEPAFSCLSGPVAMRKACQSHCRGRGDGRKRVPISWRVSVLTAGDPLIRARFREKEDHRLPCGVHFWALRTVCPRGLTL